MNSEPLISHGDAADMCAEPYATLQEGLVVARTLRAAGWHVDELSQPFPYHRFGDRGVAMVASVHHPDGGESPGDVLIDAEEVNQPEPSAASAG